MSREWWNWTYWPEYWRWSLVWEPNDPKYVWKDRGHPRLFIQTGEGAMACCFAENEL